MFTNDGKMSRRAYMVLRVLMEDNDIDLFSAVDVVSVEALAHPEWDMDERKTVDEWEADHLRKLVHESIPWEEEG